MKSINRFSAALLVLIVVSSVRPIEANAVDASAADALDEYTSTVKKHKAPLSTSRTSKDSSTPSATIAHPNSAEPQSSPPAFTTRIEKVPNTTRYEPYKPKQKSTRQEIAADSQSSPHGSGAPRVFHPMIPLQGKVDDTALSSIVAASVGLDAAANAILEAVPPLRKVHGMSVSDKTFRFYLQTHCPGLKSTADNILVVRGKWDHAEHLLEQCDIKFNSVSAGSVADRLVDARVVLINCPAELRESDMVALRKFVDAGGYLVSTDWALDGCVSQMFPQFLVWKGSYSAHQMVDAVVVAPSNPLVSGITSVAPWHLDDKCQIVELVGGAPVTVLIRSRQLSNRDSSKRGILAVTFQYGKGKVLHLVGHFDNNTVGLSRRMLPDASPELQISLRQAVTLNFICQCFSQ